MYLSSKTSMKPQNTSSQPNNWRVYIRSAIFFMEMIISILPFSLIIFLLIPFPIALRYRAARAWVNLTLWALGAVCGLRYLVEGLENIPKQNGIILCKHQSAWETIALQKIFPPIIVFILKRELLWAPFFGWALATFEPIAINRKNKSTAMRDILIQGETRLKRGRWVVIFPEGTRVAPGEKRRYGSSGGILAHRTGFPVIPVAHNAGEYWRRRGFLKYPGVIQVRIGPPIDSQNRSPDEINRQAEAWIENQMEKISAEKAN